MSGADIQLFLSDVDGVLTDGGLYYGESGEQLKRFHVHDGMAFHLLRKAGIKTGLITSETLRLIELRAAKIQPDYLRMGVGFDGKLDAAREICTREGIALHQVAYIGDDVNCMALLQAVGFPACPANAVGAIRSIPGILRLQHSGGQGAVREFADLILDALNRRQ